MKFGDLLFSRYANPYFLLDEMISCGSFFDFVIEFININNEEKEYELWLHKVWNKSFGEFKEEIEAQEKEQPIEEIETTISESKKTLMNFVPASN